MNIKKVNKYPILNANPIVLVHQAQIFVRFALRPVVLKILHIL